MRKLLKVFLDLFLEHILGCLVGNHCHFGLRWRLGLRGVVAIGTGDNEGYNNRKRQNKFSIGLGFKRHFCGPPKVPKTTN